MSLTTEQAVMSGKTPSWVDCVIDMPLINNRRETRP
jgi:hypothetical protein